MTWIIHRNNRDTIVNANNYSEIHRRQHTLFFEGEGPVKILEFETEKQAIQSFGYLLEAIKRGDGLINL